VDGLFGDAMPSFYIILETKVPNFNVYVNGNLLAKVSDALERTAKRLGVKSLMSFFSISPGELRLAEGHGVNVNGATLKPPEEKWFSAEDGLNTVRKLIHYLESLGSPRANDALGNLKEFERVLETANHVGVRWHLAIEY
jgi:hypothetical protein